MKGESTEEGKQDSRVKGKSGPGKLGRLAKTAEDAKTLVFSTIAITGAVVFVLATTLRVIDEDIVVDSIDVPPPLLAFGYKETIVSQKLLDAVMRINTEAMSSVKTRPMLLSTPRVKLEIPGTKVTTSFLLELGRKIRSFFAVNTVVSGEMLCSATGDQCNRSSMSLTLRLQGEITDTINFDEVGDRTDGEYFLEVGLKLLELADPALVVAWHYEQWHPDSLINVANSMIRSVHPERHWAFLYLGYLEQHKRNFESAIYQYQRALEIKVDFVDAYSEIALARNKLGQYDKARIAAEKALSLNPDHAPTIATSVYINLAEGDYDQAVVMAEKAISLNEKSAYIQVALVRAYYLQGDYENAIDKSRDAIERNFVWLIKGYEEGREEAEPILYALHSTLGSSLEKTQCFEHAAIAYDMILKYLTIPSEYVDSLILYRDSAIEKHQKAVDENNIQCIDEDI
ncbi:MAG: tetratricopeptide repeat protein [Gammaproteobacteria bacterium]|nr:tetratricopeptide repeat protein [Gammaproteobacteria bacterium]